MRQSLHDASDTFNGGNCAAAFRWIIAPSGAPAAACNARSAAAYLPVASTAPAAPAAFVESLEPLTLLPLTHPDPDRNRPEKPPITPFPEVSYPACPTGPMRADPENPPKRLHEGTAPGEQRTGARGKENRS
ncbi:hypothetical protein [Streptosporangium vulgare]|uniref:hypothetical protein n=1 Tax=Streptosporangium vulgare TaxID=46190 RepID=UPI0036D89C33